MFHGFSRGEPFLVIIAKEFIQEIQCILGHEMLVLGMNKSLPTLPGMSKEIINSTYIVVLLVGVQLSKIFIM